MLNTSIYSCLSHIQRFRPFDRGSPEKPFPPTCRGSWEVLDQAVGCSRTRPRFARRAALLQAGRHLGDGVPPGAADSASRAGVILHHGGQHGDIVALGSYHCVLANCDFPEVGVRGVQQLLFWKEGGIKGGLQPESAKGQIHFYDT